MADGFVGGKFLAALIFPSLRHVILEAETTTCNVQVEAIVYNLLKAEYK